MKSIRLTVVAALAVAICTLATAAPVQAQNAQLILNNTRRVEAFATTDPYVLNGLVKSWRVRPWTTVAGEWAATPVRPVTS